MIYVGKTLHIDMIVSLSDKRSTAQFKHIWTINNKCSVDFKDYCYKWIYNSVYRPKNVRQFRLNYLSIMVRGFTICIHRYWLALPGSFLEFAQRRGMWRTWGNFSLDGIQTYDLWRSTHTVPTDLNALHSAFFCVLQTMSFWLFPQFWPKSYMLYYVMF